MQLEISELDHETPQVAGTELELRLGAIEELKLDISSRQSKPRKGTVSTVPTIRRERSGFNR